MKQAPKTTQAASSARVNLTLQNPARVNGNCVATTHSLPQGRDAGRLQCETGPTLTTPTILSLSSTIHEANSADEICDTSKASSTWTKGDQKAGGLSQAICPESVPPCVQRLCRGAAKTHYPSHNSACSDVSPRHNGTFSHCAISPQDSNLQHPKVHKQIKIAKYHPLTNISIDFSFFCSGANRGAYPTFFRK